MGVIRFSLPAICELGVWEVGVEIPMQPAWCVLLPGDLGRWAWHH